MKKRCISLLSVLALLTMSLCTIPFLTATADESNLIAGKATAWFTKVCGNGADLPAVTETTFASGENVGKATDGAKTANGGFTGNDMFKLAPVDGSDSVGFKIDLQTVYSLSVFKLIMTDETNDWKLGYRAAKGMVYTSENGTDWDAGAAFDNSAQEVEISVALAAKARYVLVMITNPSAIQYGGAVRIYETELYGKGLPVTVTFDYSGADGGDITELTRDVEKNGEVGTLPAPTKTGETFLGWFDRSGAMWDATTVVTEDVTLTAKFGSDLIAGKATAWFTKAYGNGADLPTVTETTFASGENVGKATDGAKTANGGFTGNDMFKLAPVDGSDSVGFLIDLQEVQMLSLFRLTMVTQSGWMNGYRAAVGSVFTGTEKTALTKAADFSNGAQEAVIQVPLSGKARYVMVVITNPSAIQYDGCVRIYETELFGSPVPHSVSHTVSFDYQEADGGDTVSRLTVDDGEAVGALPVPTRTGYTFLGWLDADGALWDETTAVMADVTLRASWGQNLIAGKATQWFTKISGNAAALPTVTETAFAGSEYAVKATDGSTNANGGFTGNDMFKLAPVDGSDSVGFRIDLHTANDLYEFRLTMVTQNGWMNGYRAAKGKVYIGDDPAQMTPAGEFDNSSLASVIRVPLYGCQARYVMVVITNPAAIQYGGAVRIYETELFGARSTCTVTFDYAGADGGNTEASRTVDKGGVLTDLPVPTKTGCLFLGWYDASGVKVSSGQSVYTSMTLTARFSNYSENIRNLIAGRIATKTIADKATLPAFTQTEFSAGEYYQKVTDGNVTGTGGFLSTDLLALTGEGGHDAVGLLYDLGAVHSLYTYSLFLCPDEEVNQSSGGWKKSLRDVAGEIYAGTTQTNMQKIASFDNGAVLEANMRNSFAGEAARYVMVMFTRCNTAGGSIPGNRAYLYELEIYGEKRLPAADECLVTFDYGEGVFSGNGEESRIVKKGEPLGNLPAPVRIGYSLEGWYGNLNDPDSRVAPDTVMESTVVLYPRWTEKENLIAGKQGVKVIAPKGQPEKFVLTRFSGDEFSARVTDGNRSGAFLGLHVSNAYDCTAGLLFDLGDIYDVDTTAVFQSFTGWNLVRTIRGMQVYAGTSLYDLCDAKNRIVSVENNRNLTIYREVEVAARYVVFMFTDPTTDPDGLNRAETGQRYHDSGSVAHIHELEVYGTKSSSMPSPTVQNVILNKDAKTLIASEGKFSEMQEAVYATGLPGYLTLDYSRLNELDALKQRMYTMGYSYTFTNLFPEDKAVYLYDLEEPVDIKRVKCGYNWFGDPSVSENSQRYWDVYIGDDEATLFSEKNRLVGRAEGDGSNFVLDVSRRGRYVAFVLATHDRSAHVSNLEVYAGEELPSYNVTFDYRGATSAKTENRRVVSEGKKIGALPTPRKGNRTFIGWALDPEGKQPVDGSYIVMKNLTLYAVWGGVQQEETYWYPLEDTVTGVQANIRLNGASDALPTFVRLTVTAGTQDDLQQLFSRLERMYWVHDIFHLTMGDIRGEEVDIEGREIAVKLPVTETLREKTLWVMLLDGDRIERVPADLVDGFLCFTTQRVCTYAIVEPNFRENVYIETVIYDSPSDTGTGGTDESVISDGSSGNSGNTSGTTQVVVKRRKVVKKAAGSGFPWVLVGVAAGAAAIAGTGILILVWNRRKRQHGNHNR